MLIEKQVAVLVTGCNGGIGRSLCREFGSAGYRVIGTDLQAEKEAACDFYLCCDLVELVAESHAQKWFEGSVCEFMADQSVALKAVVNNAAYQIVEQLIDLTVSEFHLSQQVNFIAPFAIAKLFESPLRDAKGSIVNIGSIHARLTKPGFCAYSTSKAALSGLSRSLALEFAGEVTVNTILPAATKTAMLRAGFNESPEKLAELESFHPAGRIAEPDEIARLALFLCSESARFITGAEIPIDGGIGGRLHDPV